MKKERNLLKLLSNTECLGASKESFTNADDHKRVAESIADNGLYGIAVSHLILSTEELVKGVLLYLQYMNFDLRNIAGIHLFFTDHIIKHRFATIIGTMIYPIVEMFMSIAHKTKEKLHNPEADIIYNEIEQAIMLDDESKIEKMFSSLPAMLNWWDAANVQKNKGFYVDYSKGLETPMQVTESEYKQALSITINFQNQVLKAISYIDNMTDEDKDIIRENSDQYKIDRIFLEIIGIRKVENK